MSDGFAKMSRSDQLKIGRERLLRCLAKCGGEHESIRHLDVQNKYLDEYNTQLSKSELRKLFNKGRMQEVLQEYLAEDVEIAIDTEQHGVLFLKLKKPLEEALAHQPKIASNLVPASKEVVSTAKIVPVHRSIGNFSDEMARKSADDDEPLDEDIFGSVGREKEIQHLEKKKLMADLGLLEQKKEEGGKSATKTGQPKKKIQQHIAFFSDESDECEEENDEAKAEKPNGGVGAVGEGKGGRGQQRQGTYSDRAANSRPQPKAPKNVAAISHAEKYILRAKQNREEQAKQQKQLTEEAGKGASKMQKSDSSEDDDTNEWDKMNGKASTNGQKTNGRGTNAAPMTKYDAYLYSAIISTFMHVHKSITLSKLHNYLIDNYSDGHLFRNAFPTQAELLEFVRTKCKNIRCSAVSSNDFALLWSQDSEKKMVQLLLKVGKVLSESDCS